MSISHPFSSICITGASSGIGEAIALELAAPQITLHLTGRNELRLENVASQCRNKGATVKTTLIPVTAQKDLSAQLSAWYKENPFDLILANAGIAGDSTDTTNPAARLRLLMDVNMIGVLNTLEPIFDDMMKNQKGTIGLVGSMASFLPLPPSPAYSATKSALLTWGDAIRPNLKKHNIHLSVICPGFVRSRITDKNNYTMPFFMEADKAAKIIIKGLARKKARIAFPWPLYATLSLLSILPHPVQSFLLTKLPHKE